MIQKTPDAQSHRCESQLYSSLLKASSCFENIGTERRDMSAFHHSHFEPAASVAESARRAKSGRGISHKVALGLEPAIDAIGILAIAALIHLAYSGWNSETFVQHLAVAAVFAVIVVVGFELRRLYDFETLKSPGSQAVKVVTTSFTGFAILLALGYALKDTDEFSRVWGVTTLLTTTLFLVAHRFAFHHTIMKSAAKGNNARRLAIIGSGDQARRFLDNLNIDNEPWLRVIGVFDDQPATSEAALNGFPLLGTVDDLIRLARRNEIDDAIIAMPWSDENRIRQVIEKLVELPIGIHLGADLAGYLYHNQSFAELGQVPVLKIQNKPLEGWGGVAKAVEDRVLSALLIALFSPLMLLIAAAIKLESPGPVIFKQSRYGFNNRVFEIYKFRTMYQGSDNASSVPQATKGDPRVTRVGRALRRASLDELPQLFNVIEGKMSLVGPRPHAVEHNEHYAQLIHGYFARHRVKPGITGWAQVNGLRGETETVSKMAARVRYDVFYIENWSLAFDLRILIRTFFVGFMHPNAY